MQVALKIWRYDATSGERALQGVRDRRARGGDPSRLPRHRQGPPRRHARVPQELPDDDLRLLRHAHGRRGRARVQDAHVRDRAGGPRPDDLRDGQPAGAQGPRRRHGSVLGQVQGDEAVPPAGLRAAGGRARVPDLAGADERHPQGGALRQLRLLRLRVQRDGVRSRVPRPAGAREGNAVRRRPARRRDRRAARAVQRRARDLGVHALLLLQRALPEGRRPARRDREARRGGDQARDRPRHGREAREVVRPLDRDDRLAARDRARAEDAGRRLVDQADEVRDEPRASQQGRALVPAARGEGRGRGTEPPQARPRAGSPGRARPRAGRARTREADSHGRVEGSLDEIYAMPGAFPKPYLPEDQA